MAPMSSTEHLDQPQRDQLLQLARQSIAHGLQHGRPLAIDARDWPEALRQPGACFVTLHQHGELRGCIGSLQAERPLMIDVAENAYAAAFRDPRFPPLSADELDRLAVSISVLTPATPMQFDSEQDLLRQLRPGIDGLVLEEGHYRGTFLPSVWEQLPTPQEFLRQLKRKAGLPADHWSEHIRVSRYRSESFH